MDARIPTPAICIGETFTIAGNPIADYGCKPISETEEYCEIAIGGTSLCLAADGRRDGGHEPEARRAGGEPLVGFANPLLYSVGSRGNGARLQHGADQSDHGADGARLACCAAMPSNLNEVRVVTINSVPFLITDRALCPSGLRHPGLSGDQRGVELHLAVLGEHPADAGRLQRRDGTRRALGAEAHLEE